MEHLARILVDATAGILHEIGPQFLAQDICDGIHPPAPLRGVT